MYVLERIRGRWVYGREKQRQRAREKERVNEGEREGGMEERAVSYI